MNKSLRMIGAMVMALSMLMFLAPAAGAHDPIFLTADQTTPDTGPYMPDGSISWALYGSVLDAGDTRGFEFDLRDGDDLVLSLLIPNLSPEVDLDDASLPTMEIIKPDGSMLEMVPVVREVFDEPFSNTSYVTLAEHTEPGQAGRYTGLLTGNAPARFSVAIGINEIFFTETERSGDRPSNFAEIGEPLALWYSTPPGEEPDLAALGEGEAEMQMDLLEEVMESGEAEAPAGSLAPAVESAEPVAEEPEEAEPAIEEAEPATEEPEEADPATEDLETIDETAAEVAGAQGDDGASTTWIAPVAIAAIAVIGGGTFLARRKSES